MITKAGTYVTQDGSKAHVKAKHGDWWCGFIDVPADKHGLIAVMWKYDGSTPNICCQDKWITGPWLRSKFKVGDKVKVLETCGIQSARGRTGVVTEEHASDGWTCLHLSGVGASFFMDKELELYVEPPVTVPALREGYELVEDENYVLKKGDIYSEKVVRENPEAHPDGWYAINSFAGKTIEDVTAWCGKFQAPLYFARPIPKPAPQTVTEIDPGPGYRLLEVGELIEEGDEAWMSYANDVMPTAMLVGNRAAVPSHGAVSSSPGSASGSLSTSLPTATSTMAP